MKKEKNNDLKKRREGKPHSPSAHPLSRVGRRKKGVGDEGVQIMR